MDQAQIMSSGFQEENNNSLEESFLNHCVVARIDIYNL